MRAKKSLNYSSCSHPEDPDFVEHVAGGSPVDGHALLVDLSQWITFEFGGSSMTVRPGSFLRMTARRPVSTKGLSNPLEKGPSLTRDSEEEAAAQCVRENPYGKRISRILEGAMRICSLIESFEISLHLVCLA